MKKIYEEQIALVSHMENQTEKLVYLTSVLRSLLQLAVVTTFELIKAQTPSDEADLAGFANRFCSPSDGLPLEILDGLTPFMRSYVDKQFLYGWFEPTKTIQISLSKQLIEWVTFRNSRPGHGVLDADLTNRWAEKTDQVLKNCLDVFKSIIPVVDTTGLIQLPRELSSLKIETPVLKNGCAIVIISVIQKKGIWKLKGQQLSFSNAQDFTIDLPKDNVFSIESLRPEGDYMLSNILLNNKEHSFFHNIPIRQTNTFEGRKTELSALAEWIDDTESKHCLIHGDGGYGKTTLVLELLNQFMENQFDFKGPIPTLISYYSAKMTKWTEEGLTHFTSITPVMDDCVRELMRFFFPILPKDWYSISGQKLIDKAVGVLKEQKLQREDILLIIDNTETLATTVQEVKDLGAFFKTIGKLIGRIIITSRRREFLPADPILIEGLSEIEGVRLMRNLAAEYNATPILQAGEPNLRKVARQLMFKPILLDALVKYISRSGLGIDQALEIIFKKTNEDLLEFLYEDAWRRISDLQKEVFLVVIHVRCPLDQNSIGQACQEIGIQHSEFESSLDETYFSVVADRGRTYSLELVDLARRFFMQEFGKKKEEDKTRLKLIASKIDIYSIERERIEREYKTDRVADAFRSEYAKAAKIYADKGDIINAVEMYRLAIEDDPVNPALHDRFSWFLLNRTQEFEYAKTISEIAVGLDPSNCDALVGLALANYRLGEITNGDLYIDKAREHGRSDSFCLLRKGMARYHSAKNEIDLDKSIQLLEDALEKTINAEKINSRTGGYDLKNLSDIKKYQNLTKSRLATLRTKKTKSLT